MPRLKNVSNDEIEKFTEAAGDLTQDAHDYNQRMEQGYADEINEPLRRATAILSASRALADLAQTILVKASLQEQKHEIETMLRARTA